MTENIALTDEQLHLTLTNVVFEFWFVLKMNDRNKHLTLTNVVFEFVHSPIPHNL